MEMPPDNCGQEMLIHALTTPGRNSTAYQNLTSKIQMLSGQKGLDYVFDTYQVDALIMAFELGAPTFWTGAAGYPAGVVPLGYSDIGLPYGLMFVTRKWDEKTLISLM